MPTVAASTSSAHILSFPSLIPFPVKKPPLKVHPLFYLNCCPSHCIALTSSDDHLKGNACISGLKGLKDKA